MLKLRFKHMFLDINLQTDNSFAILGRNGSGKSILLKIITHELYPQKLYERTVFNKTLTLDEARATFGTVDVSLENFYRQNQIGVLNAIVSSLKHSYDIYPFHTVSKEEVFKAKELCERFKLKENRFTPTLSLGELKKLLIARAIIHEPEILCLDEPTNGLDIKAKFEFYELIESLQNKKILITHEFNEISSVYKETVLLKNGKIFKKTSKPTKEDIIYTFEIDEKIYRKFCVVK